MMLENGCCLLALQGAALDRRTTRKKFSVVPEFGSCCKGGQVVLPAPLEPPPLLLHLLTATSVQAREFRLNIRQYNLAFAFTSLGVYIDESVKQWGKCLYISRWRGIVSSNRRFRCRCRVVVPLTLNFTYTIRRLHWPHVVGGTTTCVRTLWPPFRALLSETHFYAHVFRTLTNNVHRQC